MEAWGKFSYDSDEVYMKKKKSYKHVEVIFLENKMTGIH